MKRYFLDRDNSSHYYVIPEEKRAEWERWSNLDEDDEESWGAPEWAVRLNHHFANMTFAEPLDMGGQPVTAAALEKK